MAAAIVGDAAAAVGGEEEHLQVPVISTQGPAVGEGHGWAIFVFGTPDLLVDLGTNFCCDETHD